jgi:hypothetical protein
MAFGRCPLLEKSPRQTVTEFPMGYDDAVDAHFAHFLELFPERMHSDAALEPSDLDDLVTILGCHVSIADGRFVEQLKEICRDCFEYLKRTKYRSPEFGFCRTANQGFVAFLLSQIFPKFGPTDVCKLPEADDCPGICVCPPDATETFELDISLGDHRLVSTGLWLNPGAIGVVTIESSVPPLLSLQIGCHSQNLLRKQGPWKRWPFVTAAWALEKGATQVSSFFGGIVYLVVLDLEADLSLHFTFSGFSRHPRAVRDNPAVWAQTSGCGAPWSEMVTRSLILTIPTERLRAVADLEQVMGFLDHAVKALLMLMSYTPMRPFRLVSDVDFLDGCVGYPVFVEDSIVQDLLGGIAEPTRGLFQMLHSLALVSTRAGCFDSITENALAYLIAILAMKTIFPSFNPAGSPACPEEPLLYRELWLIHSEINSFALLQLLKDCQRQDATIRELPEEMWISFVQDLSYRSKFNLSAIFGRVRPLPLSLTNLLKELPNPFVNL